MGPDVRCDRTDDGHRPRLAARARTEKQVVGCIFGSVNSRADVPMLLNLYKDGLLDLDGMVTRTYPLEGINHPPLSPVHRRKSIESDPNYSPLPPGEDRGEGPLNAPLRANS